MVGLPRRLSRDSRVLMIYKSLLYGKLAGNMLHLIEACILRKLIDTSAYLWPGYVVPSGTLKDTALPQESPWLNFMKVSRLSGPLIDALVASPASRCFKLCKVRSVQFGQKGISYLNTYDGRTIRYPDLLIKANDTIKIDLETNKIMDFFKFDVSNVFMVTGGRNTRRVGVIKNWEKHKASFEVIDVLLGAFCMLCLVFSYLLYKKT
ncbi:Putative ribosomal protein S4 (RPS4A) family protein [Zea mays]|uniref:Putative ribosomal protein S4 (RPS4A) family protein n=1 Tax=Zea mays TaxID=4577 RepID=A0A1D6LPK7_MAIZE|nr:Putative ribosomal protein S4 (RPS4A) family protein [Zea mays]